MPRIDEVSDAQLVTSIARYSEVALAEAYRRHGGAVFGLAKRVLNNPTDAEDVTQDVFLRLWNQPERFDSARGSLRSFLLAQAHGRAVDAVRSSSSRRAREAREAVLLVRSSVAPSVVRQSLSHGRSKEIEVLRRGRQPGAISHEWRDALRRLWL